MIQNFTVLNVADNSGAKKIMCIRILGSAKRFASIGDIIIGAVKKATPNVGVKRSEVVRAVIVRTRKELRRQDGSYIKFDDNAAIILNSANEPKGTRVIGPVARELRTKNFQKIISLAPEVI